MQLGSSRTVQPSPPVPRHRPPPALSPTCCCARARTGDAVHVGHPSIPWMDKGISPVPVDNPRPFPPPPSRRFFLTRKKPKLRCHGRARCPGHRHPRRLICCLGGPPWSSASSTPPDRHWEAASASHALSSPPLAIAAPSPNSPPATSGELLLLP